MIRRLPVLLQGSIRRQKRSKNSRKHPKQNDRQPNCSCFGSKNYRKAIPPTFENTYTFTQEQRRIKHLFAETKEQADWLYELLEQGEDFDELARQYSHGSFREFGGLWQSVQPDSLAAPYDLLAAEAENIEPGQITDLIVTAEHVFIMKLERSFIRPKSAVAFNIN